MVARLTTGIAGLDAQLGGGIPPGTVHVLMGEPMNAYELFAAHFAAGGTAVGKGVLYVATELPASEVGETIRRVGGNPAKVRALELPYKGKWVIPDLEKGHRMIVESFSTFCQEAGWDQGWIRLKALREQARSFGDNVLICVTNGLHDAMQIARLKQWADGVLELGFDRQGFGLYPFLKVTKMRGVPESSRFLLFKETEKGLFMESTRRVF